MYRKLSTEYRPRVNIIYRHELDRQKKTLVESVNDEMQIDMLGLYILFDNQDYDDTLNDLYKKPAFHMNIRAGGIHEMSPEHVLEIMELPECEHFIWISKEVCISDQIRFTWIYTHELQHLIQDLNHPELSTITNFLTLTYSRVDPTAPKRQIDIPAEFEAELKAKEVVTKFFGVDAYSSYKAAERLRPGSEEYFRAFEKRQSTWSGDLVKETLTILRSHKKAFKIQQERLRDAGYSFDFDLEKLCTNAAR